MTGPQQPVGRMSSAVITEIAASGFRYLARHSLISSAHQSQTSASDCFSLRYW